MRQSVLFVALTLAIVVNSETSKAASSFALDAKAIQIVAKTFDFLSEKPVANARLVVVGGAADLAAARLSFAKMAVAEGGATDVVGAFAVFVNSSEEARAARAVNSGVLTISSDAACVTQAACLLAVETKPRVTITVSRAVAQATGVEFDPNFKMLVTEK